jgi:hypothetical protein
VVTIQVHADDQLIGRKEVLLVNDGTYQALQVKTKT